MKCHSLQVWKRSKSLAIKIYKTEFSGASQKDFSLIRQMQRAAISISSNIAEGAERETAKDAAHFFTMAKGSAAELAAQLEIASEIGLIHNEETKALCMEIETIAKMLNSLIKSVKARNRKQ